MKFDIVSPSFFCFQIWIPLFQGPLIRVFELQVFEFLFSLIFWWILMCRIHAVVTSLIYFSGIFISIFSFAIPWDFGCIFVFTVDCCLEGDLDLFLQVSLHFDFSSCCRVAAISSVQSAVLCLDGFWYVLL